MSYQLAEQRKTSTVGGKKWETEPFSPQLNRGAVGSSLRGRGGAGVSVPGKTEIVAPFSVPSGLRFTGPPFQWVCYISC